MTLLSDLVAVSERVGAQSGRRAKIGEIAAILRVLAPDEVGVAVAYLAGETRPAKTGIGWAAIDRARAASAAAPSLQLHDVDRALAAVATTSGRGSAAERARLLSALFAAATGAEQAFLARLLIGELRQGALEGVMIDAVAEAAGLPADDVRAAAMIGGGIAAVAPRVLAEGAAGLGSFAIALLRPLAPMLAQPADDIADAMARIAAPSLEWKLDGARVQVHKSGAEVRVYSRTGNDVSAAAVEIVEAVRAFVADSLILDGEAIALQAGGVPWPFQDTMRRFGRVLDVERMRETMPLSVFFFDCLHVDGEDLISRPASERFDALANVVPGALRMPRLVAPDLAAAQAFYDETVARLHEGVMVKALDAPYVPGKRSAAWLKVKRAHTLDLVVIAAEWGHGRRIGRLSNLHLAARDPDSGGFVMLGKTFKGMTDALLEWQTKELLARAVEQDDWTVHVRPELIVEVTFNDLQASPRYPGGLALRFARVKGYRPDKTALDADTMVAVRAIFDAQAKGADPQRP